MKTRGKRKFYAKTNLNDAVNALLVQNNLDLKTDADALVKGLPVLVKNSRKEEWKIKIFSTFDDSSGTKYKQDRPYKVHNKTNTKQNFSFKYCIPVPTCSVALSAL